MSARLGDWVLALEADTIADAQAELASLQRLADNAADELHLLVSCTSDVPDDRVHDLFRAASVAVDEAVAELLAVRARLEA